MKRIILLSILLIFCTIIPVHAQDTDFYEASGADRLFSVLPKSGQQILSEHGIFGADSDEMLSLSFGDFFKIIGDELIKTAKKPLSLFASGVAVALLCALIAQLKPPQSESAARTFDAVAVLATAIVLLTPVSEMFTAAAQSLEDVSAFLISFIPVYAGILTATGQPLGASLAQSTLLGISEIVSVISTTVLVPLLTIYLAMCVVSSVSREFSIDPLTDGIKSVITVSLGALLTVFIGVLSLKGGLAQSADTVAMKTAKFATGTVFPVVGGAVSDALSSVQGSLSLVRTSVGTFASIGVGVSCLPALLSLLLTQMALTFSAAIAHVLSAERVACVLKRAAGVLSLLTGIVAVFAVLVIISLGILLQAAGGG